jgi:glucose-1-phosphate thymidylyltransferase
VVGIEEKPKFPKSNWAVTGIYFFDGNAPQIAKELRPSKRGELEIVDMIDVYFARNKLHVEKLCRAFMWLDTGTPESLLKASNFVSMLGARQSFCVASPEEIAYRNGWIETRQLYDLGCALNKSAYGQYLISLAKDAS